MALLYIGTEGSTLSVDGTHYTLRHNGKKIGRIPPVMMDEVIIENGIEISRKALDRLGNTGVSVTFMGREGEINARLVAPWRHDPDGEHAGFRPGGSILLKSIERFRAFAAKGWLEDYTPPCMDDATTL